jgi:hypothetical protein
MGRRPDERLGRAGGSWDLASALQLAGAFHCCSVDSDDRGQFSDRHNLRPGIEDACLDGAALRWGGLPQQASSNLSGVAARSAPRPRR